MPAKRSLACISAICALFVSCFIGCSRQAPVGPLVTGVASGTLGAGEAEAAGFGSASFYPLSIGNSWSYKGGGELRYLRDGVPTEPAFAYSFTETHRLIGTTTHEGTSYVVEEQVHVDPDSYYGPANWWERLRQDASGLFSLDTLLTEPPVLDGGKVLAQIAGNRTDHPLHVDLARGRPDGGPSLKRLERRLEMLRAFVRGVTGTSLEASTPTGLETMLLAYPLRTGASWSTRLDIPWPVRVDRVEKLDTPLGGITAYRIEINPGGTVVQEGEWVRVWYSRQGYLGYSIHLSGEQTNDQGEPTGTTFVADESMLVTSMSIAR